MLPGTNLGLARLPCKAASLLFVPSLTAETHPQSITHIPSDKQAAQALQHWPKGAVVNSPAWWDSFFCSRRVNFKNEDLK